MADSAQYIMDRMSGLLRQLQELEIFSVGEIGDIVRKRADFEYVMKRRQLFIEDFYGYLQYEINLDKLRMIRCQRLEMSGGKERQDAFRNVKAHFLRHICSIFDRATRRFPDNMDMWTDYLAYLKESKSISVLNTVFGKALSLHPKNEDFWIQAAVHELEENNNVHAARVMFQRALRGNKCSKKLWLRYFELELWNSSRIIERNKILGLSSSGETLFGAPSIVFKHALLAMVDLDMALEMFRVVNGLQDADFTKVLQDQLMDQFSGKAALWEALLGMPNANVSINEAAQTAAGKSDSHIKKRKKVDSQDAATSETSFAVGAATTRLQQTLKLLDDGKDAISRLNEPGQVEAFALVEAATMGKVLLAILNMLRTAQKSDKVRAQMNEGQQGSAKKKNIGGSSQEASTTAPVALGACYDGLVAIAMRFVVDISSLKGTAARKIPAVLVASGISIIPLFFSVCTASHYLCQVMDLLKEAFPHSAVPAAVSQRVLVRCDLAEVLKSSAKFLNKEKALSSHAGSVLWNTQLQAVKHWCVALEVCCKSSKECKTLLGRKNSTKQQQQQEAKSAPVLEAEIVVRSIADAGAAVASMALCLEEGQSCISKTLEALELVGKVEEITMYWRSLISSPQFHYSTRGHWCAQYLDWHLQKQSAAPAPSDTFQALKDAHAWIDKVTKASIPVTVGGDMTQYYIRLLVLQMSVFKLARSPKDDKMPPLDIVDFTRAVAERATTECPKEAAFWDAWEDVERALHNHTGANHVRWRREVEVK